MNLKKRNLISNVEKFKKDLLLIGRVPKVLIKNDSMKVWNFLVEKYNLSKTNLQIN
jgi:hypothetical protein